MKFQYQKFLELLKAGTVTEAQAKRKGINNPRQQVHELRKKGYVIGYVDKSTYTLQGK